MAEEARPSLAVGERQSTRFQDYLADVPVEIWNSIFDLVDDFATWKACAITCKAFLRHSRSYLFRRAYLKNFHNAKLLIRALHKDPDSRETVKELLLDFPAATKPTNPVVKHLFPMLCRLQRVYIQGFPSINPSFHSSLSSVGETVTALTLYYIEFQDFADMVRLIVALPHLTDLALYCPSFVKTELVADHADRDPSTMVRLSTLDFADHYLPRSCIKPLMDWLSKTSTPQTLSKMYLVPEPRADGARDIEDLIQLAKNTLHTLVLNLKWSQGPLHLSQAFALRSLRIHGSYHTIGACVSIIQALPAGSLQDLSLYFEHTGWSEDEPVPTGIDWDTYAQISALDGVLTQRKFSSLRRLNIRCCLRKWWLKFEPSSQECREYIMKEWLPNVDPRLWVDDLGDVFYVRPARLSWLK